MHLPCVKVFPKSGTPRSGFVQHPGWTTLMRTAKAGFPLPAVHSDAGAAQLAALRLRGSQTLILNRGPE
jgi:hypothetical protein